MAKTGSVGFYHNQKEVRKAVTMHKQILHKESDLKGTLDKAMKIGDSVHGVLNQMFWNLDNKAVSGDKFNSILDGMRLFEKHTEHPEYKAYQDRVKVQKILSTLKLKHITANDAEKVYKALLDARHLNTVAKLPSQKDLNTITKEAVNSYFKSFSEGIKVVKEEASEKVQQALDKAINDKKGSLKTSGVEIKDLNAKNFDKFIKAMQFVNKGGQFEINEQSLKAFADAGVIVKVKEPNADKIKTVLEEAAKYKKVLQQQDIVNKAETNLNTIKNNSEAKAESWSDELLNIVQQNKFVARKLVPVLADGKEKLSKAITSSGLDKFAATKLVPVLADGKEKLSKAITSSGLDKFAATKLDPVVADAKKKLSKAITDSGLKLYDQDGTEIKGEDAKLNIILAAKDAAELKATVLNANVKKALKGFSEHAQKVKQEALTKSINEKLLKIKGLKDLGQKIFGDALQGEDVSDTNLKSLKTAVAKIDKTCGKCTDTDFKEAFYSIIEGQPCKNVELVEACWKAMVDA